MPHLPLCSGINACLGCCHLWAAGNNTTVTQMSKYLPMSLISQKWNRWIMSRACFPKSALPLTAAVVFHVPIRSPFSLPSQMDMLGFAFVYVIVGFIVDLSQWVRKYLTVALTSVGDFSYWWLMLSIFPQIYWLFVSLFKHVCSNPFPILKPNFPSVVEF